MTGNDDFRSSGHADCIRTDLPHVLVLSRSFEGRPRASEIYTFFQFKAHLRASLLGYGYDTMIVWTGHVRETWTEIIKVRTDERIGDQVDVVRNYHQVANIERGVDASCCI